MFKIKLQFECQGRPFSPPGYIKVFERQLVSYFNTGSCNDLDLRSIIALGNLIQLPGRYYKSPPCRCFGVMISRPAKKCGKSLDNLCNKHQGIASCTTFTIEYPLLMKRPYLGTGMRIELY